MAYFPRMARRDARTIYPSRIPPIFEDVPSSVDFGGSQMFSSDDHDFIITVEGVRFI